MAKRVAEEVAAAVLKHGPLPTDRATTLELELLPPKMAVGRATRARAAAAAGSAGQVATDAGPVPGPSGEVSGPVFGSLLQAKVKELSKSFQVNFCQ